MDHCNSNNNFVLTRACISKYRMVKEGARTYQSRVTPVLGTVCPTRKKRTIVVSITV